MTVDEVLEICERRKDASLRSLLKRGMSEGEAEFARGEYNGFDLVIKEIREHRARESGTRRVRGEEME